LYPLPSIDKEEIMNDKREAIENTKQNLRELRKEHGETGISVECQGKRFTLKVIGEKRRKTNGGERKAITHFSRKARLRRLKRIAEVDWINAGHSVLLTVTYPDEVSNHTMEERKTHRYLLNRFVCKTVGKNLPCFWRVEWMPRKSGIFVGEMRPHMHLLYLTCPRICHLRIQRRWAEIIGVTRWVQVDASPLDVAEVASVYAAKYCAKECTPILLDNVPKRNRTGRHAGELRRNLIPLHPIQVTRSINKAIALKLGERASETLWWYDPRYSEGFTIIGDLALEFIADFREILLDRDRRDS
jgi:hypothetical protein